MSNFYGVDIIRDFEVAWLNSAGKPEIAVLEVFQDPDRQIFDTLKLKPFIESLYDKTFADFKTARSAIYTFLKEDHNFGESYIKLTSQQDFYPIDFTNTPAPVEFPFKTSHGLRFVCEKTQEPYIGTASIFTGQPHNNIRDQLVQVLTELRNSQFMPRAYTHELFNKRFNQTIEPDFVLSVNLNRRGGMSFQSVRCRRSIDFAEFLTREAME